MAADHPPIDPAPVAAGASVGHDVDQRGPAWQAAADAHDRVVARRMAVLAPVLILGVILTLWLVGR